MDIEELECNVLDVFQKDDFSILDKWISSYREFRLRIDTKVEQDFLYEKGTVPCILLITNCQRLVSPTYIAKLR